MTGYDGVANVDTMKNLKVGIISLDTQMGPEIAKKLRDFLPVKVIPIENERKLRKAPAPRPQVQAASPSTSAQT